MKARTSSVSTDLHVREFYAPREHSRLHSIFYCEKYPLIWQCCADFRHLDSAAGFVYSRSLKLPPLSPLTLRLSSE